MRVDTSETSLGNFGALLPSLTQLKLNNSIISSVRYTVYNYYDVMSLGVVSIACVAVN